MNNRGQTPSIHASHLDPAAKLTIVLHYAGDEHTSRRFAEAGAFTGDQVFMDDDRLHVLPDIDVIRTHGRHLERAIEVRWVRVF